MSKVTALILVSCWFALGSAFCQGAKASLRGDDALVIFGEGMVPEIKILVAPAEVKSLSDQPRVYVPAKVEANGQTYANIGLRLKGQSTFRPINGRPSLSLKFNYFTPGQRFRGLTSLQLNNAADDPTSLHEWLAARVFHDAGLPAPRTGFARVKLNGRDLGLYVLVEGLNGRFLKRNFSNPKGSSYEPMSGDIDRPLRQDGGSDRTQSDLKRLLAAARESDPARRWKLLGEVLDVDQFISFVAVEWLVGQADGYAGNANNYRICHEPESDRFVVIPHGLDNAFTTAQFSIVPFTDKVLTRAVLQTYEGRRRYRQRLGQLFTNAFDPKALTNLIVQAGRRLQAAAKTPAEVRALQTNGAALCLLVEQRAQNIAHALAQPELAPVQFDRAGKARLSGWQPTAASQTRLERVTLEGKAALHISCPARMSTSWWSTRVLLEPGKYVFTGRLRTAGVKPLRESGSSACGAGLTVSHQRPSDFQVVDSGWHETRREFTVEFGPMELELICELDASMGDAWFEEDSLRLERRQR